MQDIAREQGVPYEPDRADNVHRLNMGVFPHGARIIPNPYNKIPGFSVGDVHFVPGFPVMAWPMIEWVLDTQYAHLFQRGAYVEQLGDRLRLHGGHAHAADGAHRSASTRASRCSACRASTIRSTAATSTWASRAPRPPSSRPTPDLLAGLRQLGSRARPRIGAMIPCTHHGACDRCTARVQKLMPGAARVHWKSLVHRPTIGAARRVRAMHQLWHRTCIPQPVHSYQPTIQPGEP